MTDIEIYLVRHGLAAERGDAYPDDTRRPLTSHGIARLRKETKGLAALDVTFDQILTSPLARTRQTAEVLAARLSPKPPVAISQALAPGGKYPALIDDLGRYARRSRIALVGHEPDLGMFAARMIGCRRPIEFKKGAICRVDFEALPPTGPGHLRWFLTPKTLRMLG
jgi:phosphohistidine phosphatase